MSTRIALLLVCFACLGTAHAAPRYKATALGTLGGSASWGMAINERGQVTGWFQTPSRRSAFVYRDGTMIDLGSAKDQSVEGNAINDAGVVAATDFRDRLTANAVTHAVRYSDGTMQDIGEILGTRYSASAGINGPGTITGTAVFQPDGPGRAFVFANGKFTDLGTLGGSSSEGLGINGRGDVTGNAQRSDGAIRAFVHAQGAMRDLGTLANGAESHGLAINDRGDVTGYSRIDSVPEVPHQPSAPRHAFLHSDGKMKDLGTLGGTLSWGMGINVHGHVVGFASRDAATKLAFVFIDDTMYALQDLIVEGARPASLFEARGINAQGQIVATGFSAEGVAQAYRLDPVPEDVGGGGGCGAVVPHTRGPIDPTLPAALAAALVALAWRARRYRASIRAIS